MPGSAGSPWIGRVSIPGPRLLLRGFVIELVLLCAIGVWLATTYRSHPRSSEAVVLLADHPRIPARPTDAIAGETARVGAAMAGLRRLERPAPGTIAGRGAQAASGGDTRSSTASHDRAIKR